MAMVSPWMAQGSVVDYIKANSPVNPYATELVRLSCCLRHAITDESNVKINDVIQGLSYLHDANIVHGDLCGVRLKQHKIEPQ
jgi:serine/threonine protein kinase